MTKCIGRMPECQYFTTGGGCVSPVNCLYKVEGIYSNSASSNTTCYAGTSYTEAQPDESEAGIRKWYREQVGHEPANYDAAALKAYIAHLEVQNAELQEKVQNALQLPFKIGQIAYTITENDGVWKLDKGKIVGVEEIDSYNGKELCAIISKKAPNGEALKFYWSVKYYGEEWTTNKDVITKEFLRITGEQQ